MSHAAGISKKWTVAAGINRIKVLASRGARDMSAKTILSNCAN
jgi:hypothetical protein